MKFTYRTARPEDLQAIVTIYNHAIPTLESTCDVEYVSVESRRAWFEQHLNHMTRPIWVAETDSLELPGIVGYLAFSNFMNERPGYSITSDIAIYLHPNVQGKGLGSFLLRNAIEVAPTLKIETLATTIFASNTPSVRLFLKQGFEQWAYMPRVARLLGVERDLIMVGRRVV